ncbi:hypothetical protein JCM33374_g4525 [Metschnikowia sp. JCM 33374]|nr:hypothetical protein JCM33374_g4525 [Metschnikowia sp. JCM 33374]
MNQNQLTEMGHTSEGSQNAITKSKDPKVQSNQGCSPKQETESVPLSQECCDEPPSQVEPADVGIQSCDPLLVVNADENVETILPNETTEPSTDADDSTAEVGEDFERDSNIVAYERNHEPYFPWGIFGNVVVINIFRFVTASARDNSVRARMTRCATSNHNLSEDCASVWVPLIRTHMPSKAYIIANVVIFVISSIFCVNRIFYILSERRRKPNKEMYEHTLEDYAKRRNEEEDVHKVHLTQNLAQMTKESLLSILSSILRRDVPENQFTKEEITSCIVANIDVEVQLDLANEANRRPRRPLKQLPQEYDNQRKEYRKRVKATRANWQEQIDRCEMLGYKEEFTKGADETWLRYAWRVIFAVL